VYEPPALAYRSLGRAELGGSGGGTLLGGALALAGQLLAAGRLVEVVVVVRSRSPRLPAYSNLTNRTNCLLTSARSAVILISSTRVMCSW
jgi:hypothetical protein